MNCQVAPEWKDDVLNGYIRAVDLKLLVHPKFLDADSDAGWNEMFDWEQAIFVRSVLGDDLAKLVAMQRKRYKLTKEEIKTEVRLASVF